MNYKPTQCCRGCLAKVDPEDVHSFSWPEIRELFRECTSLPIQAERLDLPQQLCTECYTSCEKWFSFRLMCHEIDEHLRSVLAINLESTEIEPMDEFNDQNDDDLEKLNFGQLVADDDEEHEEEEYEKVEHEEGEYDDEEDYDEDNEKTDEEQVSPVVRSQSKIGTDTDTQQDEQFHWDCPLCFCKLPETVQLRDHFKEHFSDKNPQCPLCDKQFNRSSKVYAHFLSMHAQEPPEENELVLRGQVWSTKKRKCSDVLKKCPLCALNVSSLSMHLAEMHMPPGIRDCPLCFKEFDCWSHLMDHLVVHTREKFYTCACSATYTQFGRLCDHMKNFHSEAYLKINWEQSKKLTCKICARRFFKKAEFKEHSRQHILNIEKYLEGPFKCAYCPRSFTSIAVLSKHLARVHRKGDLKHECRVCGEKFSKKRHLRRHRLRSPCV